MVEAKNMQGGMTQGPASIAQVMEAIELWAPRLDLLLEGRRRSADQVVQARPYEVATRRFEIDGQAFDVQLIHWDGEQPAGEPFLYLRDSDGRLVHRTPSPVQDRPHFFTSACVTSTWAEDFSPNVDVLGSEASPGSSATWRSFLDQVRAWGNALYAELIPKKAEQAVVAFEEACFFPSYEELDGEERTWRLGHVREMVRQIYIAEPRLFGEGNVKQTKLLIRLLDRLAVSNENDALMEVLNGALDLDQATLQRLAGQLQRSSLENIVASIEVLQRRATAVQQLRHLLTEHHRDVRETPDLQRIIEANTWLFGPRYEIVGAEDDSFSKIARDLRNRAFGGVELDIEDVESEDLLPAARRQPDLFLARKFPTLDSSGVSIYKCVIIEIKRPSILIGTKHLRQLEDYSEIIRRCPEFRSENIHFELMLVGRKISSEGGLLQDRLSEFSGRGEQGLVNIRPRMKLYVMNWYSLLDGYELTYSFMLEKLKLKRADLEDRTRGELVSELQKVH